LAAGNARSITIRANQASRAAIDSGWTIVNGGLAPIIAAMAGGAATSSETNKPLSAE